MNGNEGEEVTQRDGIPLIGVVGPCTAGKSTLKANLIRLGFRVRAIAQEHSGVKDMWLKFTNPDILIYLDVRIESARQRRQISWGDERLEKQREALAHARAHADLIIETDHLSPDDVLGQALQLIHALGYSDPPLPPAANSG